MPEDTLKATYDRSRALIIGINSYVSAPPLGYAVNDANAIYDILKTKFGFAEENMMLLLNEEAKRSTIMKKYLNFTLDGSSINDRLIIFFAGHGYTARSRRGEVGYLVPYDGDSADLSTLIRWDELTRNSDLIPAKHILFIMDACYGGLAIMRTIKPGSMRFLKNMLIRSSRQVLTAGKADEAVADLGGPIPGHSIFTGHLIEGLSGKAFDAEEIITANGLMAYVYQQVGRDPESHQTPHYGYLDGDGDFVFSAAILGVAPDESEGKDDDILVTVPSVLHDEAGEKEMTLIEKAKTLLAEEKYVIELHELVARETRELLSRTSEDYFPVQGTWSVEEFKKRASIYERETTELCGIVALLGYWGGVSQKNILQLPYKRIAGRLKGGSGLSAWLALRWYPLYLLLYSGGIAAVASNKYENLLTILLTKFENAVGTRGENNLASATTLAMSPIFELFKKFPGFENHRTPHSDYMFKLLQPLLDDLLFLGSDYEMHFDRFEVLLALEAAYEYYRSEGTVLAPVGRFAWKYRAEMGNDPLHRIIKEAQSDGQQWPPLVSGLFGGSKEDFDTVATQYSAFVTDIARSW